MHTTFCSIKPACDVVTSQNGGSLSNVRTREKTSSPPPPVNLDGSTLIARGGIFGGSQLHQTTQLRRHQHPDRHRTPQLRRRTKHLCIRKIAASMMVDPTGWIAWWILPTNFAGGDLSWQFYNNNFNIQCVDWYEAAECAVQLLSEIWHHAW
jgi:hypothetical protein